MTTTKRTARLPMLLPTALLLLALLLLLAATGASAHHHPPKNAHGDRALSYRRAAKRDAHLARHTLRDSEKLALKSLKACFESNPGCLECVPTQIVGLYRCATAELGDDACAWPNFVTNPLSDGVVNACTCNDGWGSTGLSAKKWADRRERFVGSEKFVCREPCARGTDCASAAFNPASCVCI